jgi:hypothetical protein
MLGAHKELGRAIILSDHFLGHVTIFVHFDDASQTKIAYFEQAIAVHE